MKKYLIILLILFLPATAMCYSFGKNKVTQQQFKWFIHKTEHFDIYYYSSESRLVTIMADIAEEAYDKISQELGHEIKDKTPLILYESHADFRETNITLQELPEGVGGFAELFKHRIVIPFTGSMRQFRHVIFHELGHIFQYDVIYHKPVAHIYTGEFMYSPPIWFIEGTTEYFGGFAKLSPQVEPSDDSAYTKLFDWDATDEMVLRDACISNQLYHLQNLENWQFGMNVFLGYKIGESAVKYLVKTYGRDKIALIFQELRHSRTKELNQAFQNVIGIGIEEFDRKWQNYVKEKYWPMIKDKEMPELFAKQLTKSKGYVNNIRPALSPSGDLVAYVTNENDFDEIVLIGTENGKKLYRLTKDLYREEYESIRTDGSGISMSKDGDRIAFIGIKEQKDYLFILNIVTRKLEKKIPLYRLGFDICYSPSWSPEGERIVLVGTKNGQPDLYVISLSSLEIEQVTDDIFDDNSPSWHPFRDLIVYSSERDEKYKLIKLNLEIKEQNKRQSVIISGLNNSVSPAWSQDGENVIFCSDLEGIYDIYITDAKAKSVFRLTNVITGCFTPKVIPTFSTILHNMEFTSPNSQSIQSKTSNSLRKSIIGKKILFSGYHSGKQELYVMKVKEEDLEEVQIPSSKTEPTSSILSVNKSNNQLLYNKYDTKILIDAIFADFQLSSDGLLRNTTQLIASDMMGNHRLGLTLMSQSYHLVPDFIASYFYLAKRTDVGVSIFNFHEYHLIPGGYGIMQRLTGITGNLTYPINRYNRIDSNLTLYSTPIDYRFILPGVKDYEDRASLLIGDIAYVGDTTKWNQFGPYTGIRYNLTVEHSLNYLGSELDMTNVLFDVRKYLKLGSRSTFATRLFAAGSFGDSKQLFYLGGIDTLRGYEYEEFVGTRVGLLNLEVRLPFVDEIRFGWPVQWGIRGIRGILFSDFGTVWSKKKYAERGTKNRSERDYKPWKVVNNHIELVDIKGAIGIGLRLHLGYFTLDFDVARRTNIADIKPGIIYHFGLGQEF